MKATSIFSIIIPSYNRPAQLISIVKRLCEYTFKNIEIIIVDDSKVSSGQSIAGINDARVKYVHRGEKSGVSSARNLGVEYATSKYIVFLDDDDDVEEEWLIDFQDAINMNPNVDLVFCNIKLPSGDNEKTVKPFCIDINSGLRVNVIPGAFCIRKELFLKVEGYDAQLLYAENTEMFFRIAGFNPYAIYIDKPNFIYYPSADGGSKNLINMKSAYQQILKKHDSYLARNKNIRMLYLRILGVVLMRLGDFKSARGYLWKSLLLNPYELKQYLRFVLSVMPVFARRIYRLK